MKIINFDQWNSFFKIVPQSDTEEAWEDLPTNFSKEHTWTEVDCENENTYILPGIHFVNRSRYFVTEVPWNDENITVDCNDHCTKKEAKEAFVAYLSTKDVEVRSMEIISFLHAYGDLTVGDAKYALLDYIEEFYVELEEDCEDIHDFFNNYF